MEAFTPMDVGSQLAINPVTHGSNRQRNRWLRKKRRKATSRLVRDQHNEAQHDDSIDASHVDVTA